MAWLANIQGWIYPGNPACNADEEYSDGRTTHTLKPEYYTIDANGDLDQLTVDPDGCNAYSVANAADVKANSTEQFFTISGSYSNIFALVGVGAKETAATADIIAFLDIVGFTGVELDWEGFGSWTAQNYADYKSYITDLGNALQAEGYKLMIDGPPISNATEQGYYEWKYEDFDALPVDYIVALAYDWQYDFGVGTSISPTSRVENACDWMKSKITDNTRIVIGMPSYGYHGVTDSYTLTIDTKTQSSAFAGYDTATRNADHEMNWEDGGNSYFYQDTTGMNSKRTIIENKGITNISVWHLGGNDWFTGDEPTIGRNSAVARTLVVSRGVASGRVLAVSRQLV